MPSASPVLCPELVKWIVERAEARNSAPKSLNRVSSVPCQALHDWPWSRRKVPVLYQRRRLWSSPACKSNRGALDSTAHPCYRPCTTHLHNPIDTHRRPDSGLQRLSQYALHSSRFGARGRAAWNTNDTAPPAFPATKCAELCILEHFSPKSPRRTTRSRPTGPSQAYRIRQRFWPASASIRGRFPVQRRNLSEDSRIGGQISRRVL